MKELWILRGAAPGYWEIPVWAEKAPNEQRRISVACVLYAHQLEALTAFLEQPAARLGADWIVTWPWLKAFGRQIKARGVNPEHLVVWHGASKVRVGRDRDAHVGDFQPQSEDAKEFLDAAAAAFPEMSREETEATWQVFCAVAMRWLLARRAIDLGFIRLHPSPFRQNWKEVLAAYRPTLAAEWKKNPRVARFKSGTALRSLGLTALQAGRNFAASALFRWSIDVEYRPRWWTQMRRQQVTEIDANGRSHYYAAFLAFLEERFDLSGDLYTAWRAEISRPATGAVRSGVTGDTRLVPKWGTDPKVRGLHDACANRRPDPDAVETVRVRNAKTGRIEKQVVAPHVEVPAVPDIQPSTENVRDGGPDVSGSVWD